MDLICFSHLRWNFVYQRPQHLLSRFAQHGRVLVIEEPLMDGDTPRLEVFSVIKNVSVIVPHLPTGLKPEEIISGQQELLRLIWNQLGIENYVAWFYTPMSLPLLDAFPIPDLIVYDCMDELSAFKNAPAGLKENEARLLQKADLVFTGGYSLYEAKKSLHSDIHPFPSSIDKNHFGKARAITTTPLDVDVPHPRIGFFGVIDERFDIELLNEIASQKPDWHFVIVGPVVKIDPATLPYGSNIHYVGSRSYEDLPRCLAGWDVALIPFAINESTKFISPTKTPEYLAGGIPVVSTPIRDVVHPYGERGLVYIAQAPTDFIKGIEWGLSMVDDPEWLNKVDEFLADISWDITWEKMMALIRNKLIIKQKGNPLKKENEYV
jgi:glycosyltransferase involved in cell wall biosynthesis